MSGHFFRVVILVFSYFFVSSQSIVMDWEERFSGIWRARIGNPDSVDFLTIAGVEPKKQSLSLMQEVMFPLDKEAIKYVIKDGKTYLRFPLDHQERIFGLGLNFKTVEQRGRIMRLHVDHYSGVDNGRTHAPVPFYVSSKGYGIFINAPRYIDVYVGTSARNDSDNPPVERDRNTDKLWTSAPYSDNVEILIPANGVEVYVFGGPGMLDAVRRFNLFNGGGALPPKWGLGFWHRTPTLYTSEDVCNEVLEFEYRDFPLTVVGLEPGWQSKSYPCTYQWDKKRFPDPYGFIHELKRKGVLVNLWMNPYVSRESEVFQKIEPFTASHTVWSGVVPDYALKETNEILSAFFKRNHLDYGVSGYKMDENDGYDKWLWPDVALFPSGLTGEQMRQLYGVLMQKMTTELYRKKNLRTYGLVRASNAGATSFPYVIYNDYYSHPDFITALINSSFIGVLWTPEVRSSKTGEEWLRRMQTVCFSPLAMLNAWADGTKPWSFPEVEKQVKEVAKLRMQLIPYLYTSYADYAFYGTPPVRAMNLEEGFHVDETAIASSVHSTHNPYAEAIKREIKDQFMVGEYMLVAPLFAGETERRVILPKGKWFDFYTGNYVGEGEIIIAKPGLDRIPVYIKDGGIIPMMPPVTKIIKEKLPLEIRHYGFKQGSFNLYDDDGVSYDYEKGKYVRIALKATKDRTGKWRGTEDTPKNVWSYSNFTWRFMTK